MADRHNSFLLFKARGEHVDLHKVGEVQKRSRFRRIAIVIQRKNVTLALQLPACPHYRRVGQHRFQDLRHHPYAADQICQRFGLGYGYELTEAAAGSLEQVWSTLSESIPQAADYSAEQYLPLIEQQVATAQALVDEIFSPAPIQ